MEKQARFFTALFEGDGFLFNAHFSFKHEPDEGVEKSVGGVIQEGGEFGKVGFAERLPEVAAAQVGRNIHQERLEGDPRFGFQVAPDLETAQIEVAPVVKEDRPAFFLIMGGELLQEQAAPRLW